MYVWRKPYLPPRSDDVIFKRHECEWVLPLEVAKYLPYNPRLVPAVIYEVLWFNTIKGNYVHIVEHMRSDYYYNRRVFAAYGEERCSPPEPSSFCLSCLLPSSVQSLE